MRTNQFNDRVSRSLSSIRRASLLNHVGVATVLEDRCCVLSGFAKCQGQRCGQRGCSSDSGLLGGAHLDDRSCINDNQLIASNSTSDHGIDVTSSGCASDRNLDLICTNAGHGDGMRTQVDVVHSGASSYGMANVDQVRTGTNGDVDSAHTRIGDEVIAVTNRDVVGATQHGTGQGDVDVRVVSTCSDGHTRGAADYSSGRRGHACGAGIATQSNLARQGQRVQGSTRQHTDRSSTSAAVGDGQRVTTHNQSIDQRITRTVERQATQTGVGQGSDLYHATRRVVDRERLRSGCRRTSRHTFVQCGDQQTINAADIQGRQAAVDQCGDRILSTSICSGVVADHVQGSDTDQVGIFHGQAGQGDGAVAGTQGQSHGITSGALCIDALINKVAGVSSGGVERQRSTLGNIGEDCVGGTAALHVNSAEVVTGCQQAQVVGTVNCGIVDAQDFEARHVSCRLGNTAHEGRCHSTTQNQLICSTRTSGHSLGLISGNGDDVGTGRTGEGIRTSCVQGNGDFAGRRRGDGRTSSGCAEGTVVVEAGVAAYHYAFEGCIACSIQQASFQGLGTSNIQRSQSSEVQSADVRACSTASRYIQGRHASFGNAGASEAIGVQGQGGDQGRASIINGQVGTFASQGQRVQHVAVDERSSTKAIQGNRSDRVRCISSQLICNSASNFNDTSGDADHAWHGCGDWNACNGSLSIVTNTTSDNGRRGRNGNGCSCRGSGSNGLVDGHGSSGATVQNLHCTFNSSSLGCAGGCACGAGDDVVDNDGRATGHIHGIASDRVGFGIGYVQGVVHDNSTSCTINIDGSAGGYSAGKNAGGNIDDGADRNSGAALDGDITGDIGQGDVRQRFGSRHGHSASRSGSAADDDIADNDVRRGSGAGCGHGDSRTAVDRGGSSGDCSISQGIGHSNCGGASSGHSVSTFGCSQVQCGQAGPSGRVDGFAAHSLDVSSLNAAHADGRNHATGGSNTLVDDVQYVTFAAHVDAVQCVQRIAWIVGANGAEYGADDGIASVRSDGINAGRQSDWGCRWLAAGDDGGAGGRRQGGFGSGQRGGIAHALQVVLGQLVVLAARVSDTRVDVAVQVLGEGDRCGDLAFNSDAVRALFWILQGRSSDVVDDGVDRQVAGGQVAAPVGQTTSVRRAVEQIVIDRVDDLIIAHVSVGSFVFWLSGEISADGCQAHALVGDRIFPISQSGCIGRTVEVGQVQLLDGLLSGEYRCRCSHL